MAVDSFRSLLEDLTNVAPGLDNTSPPLIDFLFEIPPPSCISFDIDPSVQSLFSLFFFFLYFIPFLRPYFACFSYLTFEEFVLRIFVRERLAPFFHKEYFLSHRCVGRSMNANENSLFRRKHNLISFFLTRIFAQSFPRMTVLCIRLFPPSEQVPIFSLNRVGSLKRISIGGRSAAISIAEGCLRFKEAEKRAEEEGRAREQRARAAFSKYCIHI